MHPQQNVQGVDDTARAPKDAWGIAHSKGMSGDGLPQRVVLVGRGRAKAGTQKGNGPKRC